MTTKLAPFKYVRPETLDGLFQQVGRMQSQDQSYIFSGGGTDVISILKQRLEKPHTVVSLSGLSELREIRTLSNGKIQIGAMASLAKVISSDIVREMVPALALAANKVASPQIRNQATLGGNILVTNRCLYFNQSKHNREANIPCFKADGDICHVVKSAKRGKLPLCQARFVSDTVPVLLLLGTELVFTSRKGDRRVAVRDLFLPDGIYCKDIQPDEILSFVEIDVCVKKKIHYEKLTARDTQDFPSLGVAVGIDFTNNANSEEIARLSVSFTGAHTHPVFMEFLPTDHGSYGEMVNEACKRVSRNALTFQQDLFPRGYRKKMIEVFIRRGVKQIMGALWI